MPITIADQLNKADILVDNSLKSEEIKIAVAKKGYTEAELLKGKQLITNARNSLENKLSQKGSAKGSTKTEAQCKAEAHTAYQDLAQVARAKFKPNSPELVKLGLSGREPNTTAGFIKAGYILFDNASSDEGIFAELSKNNYTKESLAEDRAKIEAYETANKNQASAFGKSKGSTEQKNKSVAEMKSWTSEYRKIVKVALRGKIELLSSLGIPTGKRGRNKKNKGKAGGSPAPESK